MKVKERTSSSIMASEQKASHASMSLSTCSSHCKLLHRQRNKGSINRNHAAAGTHTTCANPFIHVLNGQAKKGKTWGKWVTSHFLSLTIIFSFSSPSLLDSSSFPLRCCCYMGDYDRSDSHIIYVHRKYGEFHAFNIFHIHFPWQGGKAEVSRWLWPS